MISPESPSPVQEELIQQLFAGTPALAPLADRLVLATQHDVTVLLTGETGSGKTYLARLIHGHSARRDEPLLVVPCGALAPTLVASEFFGHVKGAFTGADRPKVGRLEAAAGGTLLLDEIDTLPLDCQASLLRVLETGEFEPVGSHETRHCRARIIAASNWNLEQAVSEGRFREDLYYRLNVLSFHLPPLRERPADVEALARAMTARFAAKFGKELTNISVETLQVLQDFPWPGNVRQLENTLQYAVLISSGTELLVKHLPELVRGRDGGEPLPPISPSSHVKESPASEKTTGTPGLEQYRNESEREIIARTLESSGYSRSRTAKALGISRVTLYNKLKKYQLMERLTQWHTSSKAREK